ncbi:MAG: helix-turn-helix domain-containing protein [Cetobacterium sp.]|nr:helix-turn-helix domain-containing protein [Cetobacterium sp.]
MKNRIRELRKEKHITQEKIVENMDITRQYISLLEKSEIEPSMKVANGIAKALGVCIYEVFDLNGTGTYKCSSYNCD